MPFVQWQPRRMRRAQQNIQEKRLRFRLAPDKGYGLVRQRAKYIGVFEAGRNRSPAPETCAAFAL